MKIDLKIDSAQLVLRLRNGQRRLAYAAVNAVNNTAKRIQAAERRRVEEEFTVRKEGSSVARPRSSSRSLPCAKGEPTPRSRSARSLASSSPPSNAARSGSRSPRPPRASPSPWSAGRRARGSASPSRLSFASEGSASIARRQANAARA